MNTPGRTIPVVSRRRPLAGAVWTLLPLLMAALACDGEGPPEIRWKSYNVGCDGSFEGTWCIDFHEMGFHETTPTVEPGANFQDVQPGTLKREATGTPRCATLTARRPDPCQASSLTIVVATPGFDPVRLPLDLAPVVGRIGGLDDLQATPGQYEYGDDVVSFIPTVTCCPGRTDGARVSISLRIASSGEPQYYQDIGYARCPVEAPLGLQTVYLGQQPAGTAVDLLVLLGESGMYGGERDPGTCLQVAPVSVK